MMKIHRLVGVAERLPARWKMQRAEFESASTFYFESNSLLLCFLKNFYYYFYYSFTLTTGGRGFGIFIIIFIIMFFKLSFFPFEVAFLFRFFFVILFFSSIILILKMRKVIF